jgi:hypothetical protein
VLRQVLEEREEILGSMVHPLVLHWWGLLAELAVLVVQILPQAARGASNLVILVVLARLRI